MRRSGLPGARARAGRLAPCRAAPGGPLRPDRLLRRCAPLARAPPHCGAVCLRSECRARCRRPGLAPQRAPYRPRPLGGRPPAPPPSGYVARGLSRRLLRRPPRPRRRQLHARSPGLRQPDGDRLLGRSGTVLSFADVVYFLAHELASLRRFGLPLRRISPGTLDGFLLWHGRHLCRQGAHPVEPQHPQRLECSDGPGDASAAT